MTAASAMLAPVVELPVSGQPVAVTNHARSRYQLRARLVHDRHLTGLICADVVDALAAGRTGTRAPAAFDAPPAGDGFRFAWTEDGRTCYVLRCGRDAFVVLTTLAPVAP